MADLTNPIFTDADKARKHLESLYWPHGPICRHCGNADRKRITKLKGKSTRPGVYWCNECDKPFSVTVGTVMEDSKIPLNKWVLAFHLMASSKKGMSAHQLHRMLGVTYKTAWFLCHRIREAMGDTEPNKTGGPLGGEGKIVEADETVCRRQSEEPRPRRAGAQESRCHPYRARWPRPLVPCRQRDRQNVAPAHREEREPQEHAHDRRSDVLRQDGPRVRRASCRRSLALRIRLQARRPHRLNQQRRKLISASSSAASSGPITRSARLTCTAI